MNRYGLRVITSVPLSAGGSHESTPEYATVRLRPHVRLIVPIESTPVPVQVPTMPLAGVVVAAGALGERTDGDEHAARNEQASELATRRPRIFRSYRLFTLADVV